MYFQSDLIDLSRTILVVAMPALLASIGVLLFLDPARIGWSLLGVPGAVWILAFATTISAAPFAILLSYVVRIATVTKHTLSIGPFILRETDRDEDLDWE